MEGLPNLPREMILTIALNSTDAQTIACLSSDEYIGSQLERKSTRIFENLDRGENTRLLKRYLSTSSNFVEEVATRYIVRETFNLESREEALVTVMKNGEPDPWSKYHTLPRDEDFVVISGELKESAYSVYVDLFTRIGKRTLFFQKLFSTYLVPGIMSEFVAEKSREKIEARIRDIRRLFQEDFALVLTRLYELGGHDRRFAQNFRIVAMLLDNKELKRALLKSGKVPYSSTMYQFFLHRKKDLLETYKLTLEE